MANRTLILIFLLLLSSFCISAQVSPAAPANPVKQLGSVRTLSAGVMTLTTDQGAETKVKFASGARVLRLGPGQTDLKSATPIQLSDIQPGDRVLVRGKLSDDAATVEASTVVVMKQQDVAAAKHQELLDWQRRSVGGVVKQVDQAAKSIALNIAGAGDSKNLTVVTTQKTNFKRYSPTSVRWEDATSATLAEIHAGDQVRAKGNKSEDGSQLIAEEIVAGTFRNIAGLVSAIDAAQSTVTVQDLSTKKPVTVKFTSDSQMKKLPPQLAVGLAMRMKGGAPTTTAQSAAPAGSSDKQRNGDLNQMLGRLPAATLAELQKGDAVMVVTTLGSEANPPVVITLLDGVEPLLTASPAGKGVQSFLTPWSLAGAPGGDQ